MSIVSTDWLEQNLNLVKVLDCSWHMPNQNRNGQKEFLENHIPSSIFFDLDKNSDLNSELPHMMPDAKTWEKNISSLGIKNNDRIIIYDNSDILSSCRCWYNFIYFGHNPKLVSVLDGGLKKWNLEKKRITKNLENYLESNYVAKENKKLIKNMKEIKMNIKKKGFLVVDARSKERFEGKVAEPRKNVRSGSIENSFCMPYSQLIKKDNSFKNLEEIKSIFNKLLGHDHKKEIVFSCGSGITAAVLALAYTLIDSNYKPSIYDGSWAEYGKI